MHSKLWTRHQSERETEIEHYIYSHLLSLGGYEYHHITTVGYKCDSLTLLFPLRQRPITLTDLGQAHGIVMAARQCVPPVRPKVTVPSTSINHER